jgi:hypothetical protein
MAHCELLTICPFFSDQLKNMLAASNMMKRLYCRWIFAKCARYKVVIVLGKDKVSSDLFPGGSRRADEILIQENKTNKT